MESLNENNYIIKIKMYILISLLSISCSNNVIQNTPSELDKKNLHSKEIENEKKLNTSKDSLVDNELEIDDISVGDFGSNELIKRKKPKQIDRNKAMVERKIFEIQVKQELIKNNKLLKNKNVLEEDKHSDNRDKK